MVRASAVLAPCLVLLASRIAGAQEPRGDDFAATARLPAHDEATRLDAQEMQVVRRRLGESFSVVEALPGTLPVFSGVPYLLVRGAPPGGSTQYYDGVPVPSTFHLALGPSIAHPALIGGMRFHAGVAPARFGRRTGGVLQVQGPPPAATGESHSELELRLLDGQALHRTRRDVGISVHARVGYPQLMLDAVDTGAVLGYWDYQFHLQRTAGPGTELTMHVFGAADRVGDRADPDDDIELQFHRALLRMRHRSGRTVANLSTYVGYERGVLGRELDASSLRVGPSAWVEHRSAATRVRLGADVEVKLAELQRMDPTDEVPLPPQPGGADPDRFLPDRNTDNPFETGPEDFVDRSPLRELPGRSAVGAYAELALRPGGPVEVEMGLRGDTWIAGSQARASFDPRLMTRFHLASGLRAHAGAGLTHQAPSSPLPIPGLSDYELDRGLSRAAQAEAGVALELPLQSSLQLTVFGHRYDHLVFLELVLDCDGNTDPLAPFLFSIGRALPTPQCARSGLPRGDGHSYGAELRLQRALTERLGGWLNYTLAGADARASDGTAFTPQFDVRHVLDAVLTYDWGDGFESGLRLHYRSGKPAVNTIFDFVAGEFDRVESRLPPFFRADVQLTYGFDTRAARFELTLQWLNLTFSREATKRDCVLTAELDVSCRADLQPAIVLPNAGLRAWF
ncbi:MAG: TonB-dependent receptor [Myxococcales bacterium]|jgi:hypothetical protein